MAGRFTDYHLRILASKGFDHTSRDYACIERGDLRICVSGGSDPKLTLSIELPDGKTVIRAEIKREALIPDAPR